MLYFQMLTDKRTGQLFHRGIIQWQYHGLQNRSWGFESLFPCSCLKPSSLADEGFLLPQIDQIFLSVQKEETFGRFPLFCIFMMFSSDRCLFRFPRSFLRPLRLQGTAGASTCLCWPALLPPTAPESPSGLHLFRRSPSSIPQAPRQS